MDEQTVRHTVTFPASRAFVVQLAASAGDDVPDREEDIHGPHAR
jgi:hypothetical protein